MNGRSYRQQSPYNQQRLAEITANTIRATMLKPGEKDPTLWSDVGDLLLMTQGVDLTPWSSVVGSIASQIIAAQGRLLPVDAQAFERDRYDSFERNCFCLNYQYGVANPREAYERLGMVIREPQEGLPGWYRCQLPDGWHVKQDTPIRGHGEQVVFYDAMNEAQFMVFCHKVAKTQCSGITLARP